MEAPEKKTRIAWYRCPVSREDLTRLNKRSDFKGFLQAGGYLGLLAVTGTAACLSAGRLPWPVVVLLFFFHGMCFAFMINGFHELVHDSVFRTRFLNVFFLRILSFLGWYNHHYFWASHTEHHKYTLHPPDDLEVVLPYKLGRKDFYHSAIINFRGLWGMTKANIRLARGKLEGPWEHALFPESDPAKHRRLFNWARINILGHATIVGVSLYMHWWLVPVAVTLAPYYGGWLFFLCNNSQHIGLRDNAPDFRLCCRTIIINPFVSFLYWRMNYHTEHHMYAAVPCYNLAKLHKVIKADMPPCPVGLIATWKEISAILAKQKVDPTYQYTAPVPAPSRRTAISTASEPSPVQADSPLTTN